jgi:hypothetical protein
VFRQTAQQWATHPRQILQRAAAVEETGNLFTLHGISRIYRLPPKSITICLSNHPPNIRLHIRKDLVPAPNQIHNERSEWLAGCAGDRSLHLVRTQDIAAYGIHTGGFEVAVHDA